MNAQSQELERYQTQEGVPPELAEAGVRIETDGNGGYRALTFPDAIHDNFNVLLPNAEIVRSDPNWTPNLRSLTLDLERHSYHDSSSKKEQRSLNKLGLYALASVAGVTVESTSRLPRTQLRDREIGWQAVVSIRRSDGTPLAFNGSKVIDLDVLKHKCEVEAGGDRGRANKRYLYEREHVDAKAETKAIERAIRAALQIPHAFEGDDLTKPFLVVGYSFTPDWTDPETKRLLVERGLSAGRQVFGELPAPPTTPPEAAADGAEAGTADASGQQAEPARDTTTSPSLPRGPRAGPVPDPEPEPEPPLDGNAFEQPSDVELTPEVIRANEAAEVEIPSGRHKGTKLRDLLEMGDNGIGWIRWALRNYQTDPFKSAVWAFAQVYAPDIFEQVSNEKAQQA